MVTDFRQLGNLTFEGRLKMARRFLAIAGMCAAIACVTLTTSNAEAGWRRCCRCGGGWGYGGGFGCGGGYACGGGYRGGYGCGNVCGVGGGYYGGGYYAGSYGGGYDAGGYYADGETYRSEGARLYARSRSYGGDHIIGSRGSYRPSSSLTTSSSRPTYRYSPVIGSRSSSSSSIWNLAGR